LIELLVVVAIIALLVSILLPSLSKAREQAKTSVCASQLRSFGQASALYEHEFDSFAPCDPWNMTPELAPGAAESSRRNPDSESQKMDPAHGWLVRFGMRINPTISNELYNPWERYAWGFRMQVMLMDSLDELWEGFFCPSQNRRNTTAEDSPELDGGEHVESYPTFYKYAAAYMVNRHLRAATTKGDRQGVRWPIKPSAGFETRFGQGADDDNIFANSPAEGVEIDINGGAQFWHTQAVNSGDVVAPGETMYMADSLDYHLSPPSGSIPYTGAGWTSMQEASAGLWTCPFTRNSDRQHTVLGARHLTKANVLYADSHVDNDNQIPRDKRGSLVIASTFADYMDEYQMGTQHHLAPFGRSP